MKFDNVLQTIGNTPIIRMHRVFGAGAKHAVHADDGGVADGLQDVVEFHGISLGG